MKHLKTNSDIGAVLIGNKDWAFAVPNLGGDGTTHVFIIEDGELKYNETENYDRRYYLDNSKRRYHLKYISNVYGKFGIYRNDIDDFKNDKAIEILDGKYNVYQGEWCVAFEKSK